MELRDLVGWLLVGVALFGAVGGAWAAWYFAHHRVYARQLRRERRARRAANVSRASDSEGLAPVPSQPFACDASPTTLMRYGGVFSASAERDQCSFVEAEQADMQPDRQPRVTCEIVQAISVEAVGSETFLFAPVARSRRSSSPVTVDRC